MTNDDNSPGWGKHYPNDDTESTFNSVSDLENNNYDSQSVSDEKEVEIGEEIEIGDEKEVEIGDEKEVEIGDEKEYSKISYYIAILFTAILFISLISFTLSIISIDSVLPTAENESVTDESLINDFESEIEDSFDTDEFNTDGFGIPSNETNVSNVDSGDLNKIHIERDDVIAPNVYNATMGDVGDDVIIVDPTVIPPGHEGDNISWEPTENDVSPELYGLENTESNRKCLVDIHQSATYLTENVTLNNDFQESSFVYVYEISYDGSDPSWSDDSDPPSMRTIPSEYSNKTIVYGSVQQLIYPIGDLHSLFGLGIYSPDFDRNVFFDEPQVKAQEQEIGIWSCPDFEPISSPDYVGELDIVDIDRSNSDIEFDSDS